MIITRVWARIGTFCLATALSVSAANVVVAQTRIQPGFNLFSTAQDEEIGRQSADEAERQLPILRDKSIDAYVGRVGDRLAAVAPGAQYDYQFKVVNVSDINAFALPGGYLYLNRGLIEAAENEGQLAGVMAHEMAHVALRHGTNQASKAYVGQAGLGLLGGLIGKDDHSTDKTLAAIGGFGLNTLFLKFSRTAEEQADITGAQMMAKAGYDPADMVAFFDILAQQQRRDPSKVEQFFSSHPAPANRAARINEEIDLLTVKTIRPIGGFAQVQSELSRMRPAPSMQQIAQGQEAPPATQRQGSTRRSVPVARVDGASKDFRVFEQRDGLFRIEYPDNWNVHEADRGYGAIIAPEGGYVDAGGQERDVIAGVIINHYDPLDDDSTDRFSRAGVIEGNTNLIRATNDLVAYILRNNPDMQVLRNSERRGKIDQEASLSVVLSGRSPVTRQQERVTLFSREIPDERVIYALFIAPEQDYERLNTTFNRMISSLQVSAEPAHEISGGGDLHSSAAAGRSAASRVAARKSVAAKPTTVPSGTVLMVSFQETLSSATSQSGDRFTARVVEPVRLNGRVAIPAASLIFGRVVAVEAAKSLGGQAQLNLEFTTLQLVTGGERPITASLHSEAKSQKKKDAVTIGGAAAGGAVLGHVIGNDRKGTVLGALIGGAIGTGIAARNKGEEVTLPEGVAVAIHLDSPFTL